MDSSEPEPAPESAEANASASAGELRLDGIDLHNTDLLAGGDQHRAIYDITLVGEKGIRAHLASLL